MTDDLDDLAGVLRGVPGGLELLAWFGGVPSFHDGEVLSLHLDREGPSALRVYTWRLREVSDVGFTLARHAVVTFTLTGIVDLDLGGFSRQNVLGGLVLRRALDRPERRPSYDFGHSPNDYEIEMEPCVGLNGHLRANAVEVRVEPCAPAPPALALDA